MLETIKEAIGLLIEKGYVIPHKEHLFTFTDKIYELDPTSITNTPPRYTKSVSLVDPLTKSVIPAPGEQSVLIKFILDAEVPEKMRTANGTYYWVRKYSKEAEKELIKLLNQGYQYDILVASTKLYYQSSGYCEAMSNYLIRGTWITHYEEMKKQLEAGTVNKHIQNTLQEKGGTDIYDER